MSYMYNVPEPGIYAHATMRFVAGRNAACVNWRGREQPVGRRQISGEAFIRQRNGKRLKLKCSCSRPGRGPFHFCKIGAVNSGVLRSVGAQQGLVDGQALDYARGGWRTKQTNAGPCCHRGYRSALSNKEPDDDSIA